MSCLPQPSGPFPLSSQKKEEKPWKLIAAAFPLLRKMSFWRLGSQPPHPTPPSNPLFLVKQCLSHMAAPIHTHTCPKDARVLLLITALDTFLRYRAAGPRTRDVTVRHDVAAWSLYSHFPLATFPQSPHPFSALLCPGGLSFTKNIAQLVPFGFGQWEAQQEIKCGRRERVR